MYTKTTFLHSIPYRLIVPALKVDGRSILVIQSLEVEFVLHIAHMKVRFGMLDLQLSLPREAKDFLRALGKSLVANPALVDDELRLEIFPVPGQPLTETLMEKYVGLLVKCDAYADYRPRLISEKFVGKPPGLSLVREESYTAWLQRKVLRKLKFAQ
jgi:hypothetical protein